MFDRLSYITWYHATFGTNKKAAKALAHYGGFEELYEVVNNDADTEGLLSGFSAERLKHYSIFDAGEINEVCKDMGGEIISFESPYYPGQLKKISNAPYVIFCHGDKEVLRENLFVSVVGSRDATDEALAVSYGASYNMAKSGAVIVSGAALGVDTAAHKGAIAAGGATVGVLGCGLGSEYMWRIGDFYNEVLKNGVYITEMLPFVNPSRYSFPERNRIISGMSNAVLVTYAGAKSGSLITADLARKQKRRVYAMSPDVCASDGCRNLIAADSYVFYNAGDIIYPFSQLCRKTPDECYCNKPVKSEGLTAADYALVLDGEKEESPVSTKKKPAGNKPAKKQEPQPKEEKKEAELPAYLSDDARKVYQSLKCVKTDVDSLVPLTGLPISNILAAVSELEIFGFVKSLPGKMVEKA